MKIPNCTYIGHVAVFYVPKWKLDRSKFGGNGQTPREMFHDYFVKEYQAYTHEASDIQGFWKGRRDVERDEHERFEVAFKGKKRVSGFVKFLSKMCALLEEDCIYLTMGYKSWLIWPES